MNCDGINSELQRIAAQYQEGVNVSRSGLHCFGCEGTLTPFTGRHSITRSVASPVAYVPYEEQVEMRCYSTKEADTHGVEKIDGVSKTLISVCGNV